ncbi:MAG: DUF5723 family protein [Bacteroidales bacterium]|jgi:hypothetical protein
MRRILSAILLSVPLLLSGQQNQQLFQMHYLGESNFLNPAVQSECKWFIGIPVLSSVHLNYANSGFSYKQLVKNISDSAYSLNIDKVANRLGWRTLVGTELHTTLLAIGYKRNDYYYAFSIIEKNNLPFTFSKDLFSLVWEGNSSFEGRSANFRGTSAYAMHYREYALGVSKQNQNGNYLGIKGKLLFGKLNLATPKSDVSLYTDENTFDLTLEGEMLINMSGPVVIEHSDDQIANYSYDESISIMELIFNRKNWGLAFDAGFIHRYNENITLSGSIIDLGFIRWRSNLNNISFDEYYTYRGILTDSGNVVESIIDSVYFTFTNRPYTTFLPPKMYLGTEYHVNEKLKARALISATAYRTKFCPALTIAADYNPFGYTHIIGSYSVMYRSLKNLGLGFSVGREPLQFYMISDNVLGLIWPLSTRNINLRFGLNINLGCKSKEDRPKGISSFQGYCPVYEKDKERKKRKSGWRKKTKR